MTDRSDLQRLLTVRAIRAFLRAIRLGEGTSDDAGYSRLFGGGNFTGFADHPNQLVTKSGISSTAAGAYQFLFRTWHGLVQQFHFADFSPQCQDEAAVALLVGAHADSLIMDGKIEAAVQAANRIWASLPGSPHGQPTVTIAQFMAEYNRWLAADPLPQTVTTPEKPVPTIADAATAAVTVANPVVGAALSVFRSLWPELKPLFTGPQSSEVAQRNVAAAEAVVNAVMAATGSATPAAAIDAVQADPQMAQQARAAAVDTLDQFDLIEVAGGVAAARTFASSPQAPDFWKTGAWWVTVFVFGLMGGMTIAVLIPGSPFGADTRATVVGQILMAFNSALVFWLGLTYAKSTNKNSGG